MRGDDSGGGGGAGRGASLAVRPQALLLTFCAHFLLDQPDALFTGSFIEALTRTGVGEHAARTTLTRMCKRGFFTRHKVGTKVYLSLTTRTEQLLRDAETRVWLQGAVNRSWSGTWTLLSFSLPEARRADRHQLRKRLLWEGFGMLHSGLWVLPSSVDAERMLSELNLSNEVKAFRATAIPPTEVSQLVRDAWDLDALSRGYLGFLDRWDGPKQHSTMDDPLARYLSLLTEWLLLVRMDPHLPESLLPADWPAVRAERLVVRLRESYSPAARSAYTAFADRQAPNHPEIC